MHLDGMIIRVNSFFHDGLRSAGRSARGLPGRQTVASLGQRRNFDYMLDALRIQTMLDASSGNKSAADADAAALGGQCVGFLQADADGRKNRDVQHGVEGARNVFAAFEQERDSAVT